MQFTVTINQAKALEWGLNAQQALLFAFVYESPSWAKLVQTADGDFYALSKAKIIEELPLLTDKADTAYRLLKQLAAIGVIGLSSTASITLVRITEKGQEWNRKLNGSEKYSRKVGKKSEVGNSSKVGKKPDLKKAIGSEKNPIKVGKISDVGRKKIREGSEKSPTNQDTSNQVTKNQDTSQVLSAEPASPAAPTALVLVVDQQTPRCDIPADMPGPKDPACKTFKAWANYAMAYRKRYHAWPVWNAKVAGQIGQLVDRLGAEVAHHVSAYFLTVNESRVVAGCHSIGDLLARAEAYHTQWSTNRQMTATRAQQIDQSQSNRNTVDEALEILRQQGAIA